MTRNSNRRRQDPKIGKALFVVCSRIGTGPRLRPSRRVCAGLRRVKHRNTRLCASFDRFCCDGYPATEKWLALGRLVGGAVLLAGWTSGFVGGNFIW